MESNDKTLIDIVNQQSITIHQLESLLNDHNNSVQDSKTPSEVKQTNEENNIFFEHICLVCNQLISSKDIVNHLQINKDHIDHCIHIDKIKDQLLDVKSNNRSTNGNNNIFKKRLELLWSSLKRLSTTYSSLNSKIDEISNHFKQYYVYLMMKEHSLKKQLQDDIDTVNNDITHVVKEFKSIIDIANISNNTLYNSSQDKYTENDSQDTTNKYSIPSIIESIQQSVSYNMFVDYNKNTLFYNEENKINLPILDSVVIHNITFNSSLLNTTENNSQPTNINENLYIVKVKQQDHVYDQLQKVIDQSITLEAKPSALVRIGDLERFKEYYKRNHSNKLTFDYKSKSNEQIEIKGTIIEILKSNRTDILEYLFQEVHFDIKTPFLPDVKFFRSIGSVFDLLAMSVLYSNLETIQFIESFGIKNNIKWNYDTCLEVSPFSNNIKVLEYFSKKVMGVVYSVSITNILVSGNAALLGHLNMIEWISRNTPFVFTYKDRKLKFCMDVAASEGHLDILKWLHHNRSEGCSTDAMDGSAWIGYLETIKWLHENRTEGCTTDAMNNAARNGHLETIKWLHHNRTEGCTTDAMNNAALNGHLEIINWLHENRTEGCTTNAIDAAAKRGHLETIKWLHENRTEGCTTWAMDCAAEKGHLETIKWLHENRTEGCTTWAMNHASENGHLETIKWLHENRTECCIEEAKKHAINHLETLEFLNSVKVNKGVLKKKLKKII